MEQLRLKQLQNATFEDITEVEETVIAGDFPSLKKHRRLSNTFTKFPNAKRKRTKFGGGLDDDDEFDADDPEMEAIGGGPTGGVGGDDDDDMVMYDPNESIIAGPEDEEDDL